MNQKGGVRFKPSHMSRRKSRKVLGRINKNKRYLSIKSRPLPRTYKSYKKNQSRKAAAIRREIEKFARRARGENSNNNNNNNASASKASKASKAAANRSARVITRALEQSFHDNLGKKASPSKSKSRRSRKNTMNFK
jgi:lysozyme family protein